MSRDDFWSRRKAAVEAEEAAITRQDVERARETSASEISDEDLLKDLGLPDPDSLDAGDDFSAFMNSAVPTRLRNRALRKLWATNPVLANIDGLVEYGEDYADAATVLENLQTAYQVGKGMTKHVEEMLRQAEAEAAENPSEQPEEDTGDTPEDVPSEIIVAEADPVPEDPPNTLVDPATEFAGKPRRMRYSFSTDPGEDE